VVEYIKASVEILMNMKMEESHQKTKSTKRDPSDDLISMQSES
jgi:hypothetical protein